jgi:hypothetical protein
MTDTQKDNSFIGWRPDEQKSSEMILNFAAKSSRLY